MRIAMAQIDTVLGDFEAIVGRMEAMDGLAHDKGADLVIYPSATFTGYDPAGLLDSEAFGADVSRALDRLAGTLTIPTLVPFLLDFSGAVVAEAALVRDGRVVPLRMAGYLSTLSGSQPHGESEPPVGFSVGEVEFGVAFDYVGLDAYASGTADADVVVYVPFDAYDTDDEATALAPSVGDGCYVREASEANSWLVAVGAVGGYDDVVYCGGSFVLTPWGELAAVAPSFEESLTLCEVDPTMEGPLAAPVEAPLYQRMDFLWDALVLATRDFAGKLGYDGVGLILTGDLPTSALAVLAVDALGPTRVHGLIAPLAGAEAMEDARALAGKLRIPVSELSPASLDEAAGALACDPGAVGTFLARARLAAMAQGRDLLMASAVDKTALATGQDPDGYHDAAFAPFVDVYRTDLLALAVARNRRSPLLDRTVLARLAVPEGLTLETLVRTDEGRLSELDGLLLRSIEQAVSLTESVADGVDRTFAEAVFRRLQETELARRSAPLGPVVSDCTLLEWARPVVAAWRESYRPEDLERLRTLEEEDGEGLLDRLGALGADTGDQGSVEPAVSPQDMSSYLQDFAQSGGLRADGDDIWGAGLFSKN